MENFITYLFRLNELGGPGEEHHPVLFTSLPKSDFPTPCPGIMRQKDIERALSGEIPSGKLFAHSVVPFGPRKNMSVRQRIGVPPNLIPMNPKQLIEGHRVEIVDKFPMNSLKEVVHIANERGGTSFILEKATAIRETLKKLPNVLTKQFKYFDSFSHILNHNGREMPDENLHLFVTFLDLRYCMPIYDTRKIDGAGIIVGTIWPLTTSKHEKLYFRDMYSAVATNFQENIFKIDGGSNINSRNGFNTSLTEHVLNGLKSSLIAAKPKQAAGESGNPKIKKGKKSKKSVETLFSTKTYTTAYFGGKSGTDSSTTTW